MRSSSLDRRSFARLFAAGGSAALLARPDLLAAASVPVRQPSPSLDGAPDWEWVRAQFLLPEELSVLNAANLCPSPRHVLESVHHLTERLGSDPVPSYRAEMHEVKAPARAKIAAHLRVSPEDILITRNTSEGNNFVSSGLDLGVGDEVLIFGDNHPSNNAAWKRKGERFGFTVREVPQVNPHPGFDFYVEAFSRAITPATKVLAFTHLTNTAGDLFPAKELCALAREHDVISLVDGAQSFGLLDVDLSDIQPDFYTGSGHKWPCGPMEAGVLYVNARVQDRFWPSIVSAYVGETPLASTHEGLGQRDEPAIRALGEEMEFLSGIGQAEIEARSRELATAAIEGLAAIDGIKLWTSTDPGRRAAVVSFQPGNLEPARVIAALEADGIVASPRNGEDRPGTRFSPHFYNSFEDVERGVAAIRRYLRRGL